MAFRYSNTIWVFFRSITNYTIFDNTADTGGGLTIFGRADVHNSIFWGNTEMEIFVEFELNFLPLPLFEEFSPELVSFSHCDIQGSGGSGGWNIEFASDQRGNIDKDPLFINPNDADGPDDLFGTVDDGYRLDFGSPCIDAARSAVPGYRISDLKPQMSELGPQTSDLGPQPPDL